MPPELDPDPELKPDPEPDPEPGPPSPVPPITSSPRHANIALATIAKTIASLSRMGFSLACG